MTTETEDVRERLMEKSEKRSASPIPSKDFLSTGSTLLNLACSGRISGGLPKGTMTHYVGDSDSGKTFFGLCLFAEAARNQHFDQYDLRFWNAEGGALMDQIHFFGAKAAERVQEQQPETLEDFYYSMDEAFNDGRPFVGVLDSMDALYPKAWYKKFKAQKRAAETGKEETGTYAMEKAKINSECLRRLRSQLRKSGSILVLISQTRDNVGGMFEKRSVSSGRALKFYSVIQLWTALRETLKKTVMGKPRAVGIVSQIDIKKNHVTGNKRRIEVPILNDYGVDDVRSCINFLVEEGHWTETKGRLLPPEFADIKKSVSLDRLIEWIETNDEERTLRHLVKTVWESIEEGCQSNRPRRYE